MTDEHKAYAKRTQRTTKVSGLVPSVLSAAQKINKTVENMRKLSGHERTRVVYSRDVKPMKS